MASTRDKKDIRRQNIPVIYVKGTHYEVGFDVVGGGLLELLQISI